MAKNLDIFKNNIIYRESFLIRNSSSEFRDAKMRYYMELRKKLKDANMVDICNSILNNIYAMRYEEIMAKS